MAVRPVIWILIPDSKSGSLAAIIVTGSNSYRLSHCRSGSLAAIFVAGSEFYKMIGSEAAHFCSPDDSR